LVRDEGYSVPEAAKSLDIATNMLYKWKEKLEGQLSGISLEEDERVELKRLRKENKELRMEKEIFKKASIDSRDHCNARLNHVRWCFKFNVFLGRSFN